MILGRQELANAMGVQATTVDRWVREGCPVQRRSAKGIKAEYNLPDVVKWWGDRERENATGGTTSDLEELKRRSQVAATGRAELEFAKLKGEVAPIRDFERSLSKIMAAIRQNVMNVPARAVLQLLGETDETLFKKRLRAELTLALEQAAQAEFDLDDEGDDDAEADQ